MRVCVTGVTGFVGAAVARYFFSKGHEVTGIGRSSTPPFALRDCCHYICTDINFPVAPIKADVCVHAAALASDRAMYRDLYMTNVTGTGHVLAALKECRRFIYISSSSVYPFHKDIITEEDAHPATPGLSDYGKTKLLAEKLVIEDETPHLEKVILRPRAVYGPGDRILLPRLLRLKKGKMILLPSRPAGKLSMTHINNLLFSIERSLYATLPERINIYNVADAATYDLREIIIALLEKIYGHKLHVFPVSNRLLEMTAALNRSFPLFGISRFALQALTQNAVLSIHKIQNEIGFRPAENFNDSCESIAEWIGRIGGVKTYTRQSGLAPFL